MSFISNILDDIEMFITNKLLAEKESEVTKKIELMERKQASLDYQKTDLIFLTKKGFEYNHLNGRWTKTENFDYGKYPGRYKIEIIFPSEYPKSPPIIKAHPLDNIRHTEHILGGNNVCIAEYKGSEQPNSYWKKNMNAKGALLLAYHVITDEISTKKMKDKNDLKIEWKDRLTKINSQVESMSEKLKGSIFENLMQVMLFSEFKQWYENKYSDDSGIEYCNTWLQVSDAYKSFKTSAKNDLIKLYTTKLKEHEAKVNDNR